MNRGFQNSLPLKTCGDGRNFVLAEDLVYVGQDGRTYRAPVGSETDGLSVPPPAWPIIAPFGCEVDGKWCGWFSGILHDAAYRNTLEVQTHDGNWIKAKFDQSQCDSLIAEALESEGVPGELRVIVYEALRGFGNAAFEADRKVV